MEIALTVNGSEVKADVADRMLLVHFLREHLNLTATKVGCDTSSCGACTVLLDGQSVKSCTVLAAQADGLAVTTIEGLANGSGPRGVSGGSPPGPAQWHAVQRAFRAEQGRNAASAPPAW